MALASPAGKTNGKELDPMSCLAKKNIKYAGEVEEVFLSNLDGTSLSPNFEYFTSLSVAWLNNNIISRIENMDACFRLRELYIENNKLVSLAFLPKFKFLQKLLASNNQIRNLDKQLLVLEKASFLKNLDLFGNPLAEEPDYRLRLIYKAPQIVLLDRLGVTLPQRQRADEIVPNIDKVAASEPVKGQKKPFLSSVEKDCYRTAKNIVTKRLDDEEKALISKSFTTHFALDAPHRGPLNKATLAIREKWSSPVKIIEHELNVPTPWEKRDMEVCIKQLAGKEELTKDDVTKLSSLLRDEGLEQVGRMLSKPDVFAPLPTPRQSSTDWMTKKQEGVARPKKLHPLETLMLDPNATMPAKDVIAYLLSLEWARWSDGFLDDRIAQHYHNARMADLQGDKDLVITSRNAALRLEGVKTRKQGVGVKFVPEAGVIKKSRSDVLTQSLLQPSRGCDEFGKTIVQVAHGARSTKICG